MVLKQAITIQKVVRRIVCLGDMIVIALVKGSTHSFILLNWQFPVVVVKGSVRNYGIFGVDEDRHGWHGGEMARALRVQYAGASYHVLNRGDRREAIFKDKKDHEIFLQTLAQACAKTGWQAHAWCLVDKVSSHSFIKTNSPSAVRTKAILRKGVKP
jgi:hypothetical protein